MWADIAQKTFASSPWFEVSRGKWTSREYIQRKIDASNWRFFFYLLWVDFKAAAIGLLGAVVSLLLPVAVTISSLVLVAIFIGRLLAAPSAFIAMWLKDAARSDVKPGYRTPVAKELAAIRNERVDRHRPVEEEPDPWAADSTEDFLLVPTAGSPARLNIPPHDPDQKLPHARSF